MIRSRITEFLIALGMVAVLFLVIGFVLPAQRHMSESIGTNRKATIVYDTVNSFRRFKDWSPLLLRDPKLQINLVGRSPVKGPVLSTVPIRKTSVAVAGKLSIA